MGWEAVRGRMWVYELIVEEDREDHIARHGVLATEAREVVLAATSFHRERYGYYRVTGQTAAGR